EICRQLGWAEQSPRLYHYREHSGAEVDALLETTDGRIAAIEIKATATVRAKDIRWLKRMQHPSGRSSSAASSCTAARAPCRWANASSQSPSTSSGPQRRPSRRCGSNSWSPEQRAY
ncbi:MAG: DUF4143 domain-containing protein, partial [Actinomycetota bacterium]|nr:DUF4143 domain-containing protein [Actinomycetota bacterium]